MPGTHGQLQGPGGGAQLWEAVPFAAPSAPAPCRAVGATESWREAESAGCHAVPREPWSSSTAADKDDQVQGSQRRGRRGRGRHAEPEDSCSTW